MRLQSCAFNNVKSWGTGGGLWVEEAKEVCNGKYLYLVNGV